MQKLPADPARATPPIAVDAMADADDAAEAFEIDVQQIADVRPLVALDRRRSARAARRDSARRGPTRA